MSTKVTSLARRDGLAIKGASHSGLTRVQASKQLSRKLPYYLVPEEVHQLIQAADNARDRLFLRTLWETGARVSEAIAIKLADVSREGVRILGKGGT